MTLKDEFLDLTDIEDYNRDITHFGSLDWNDPEIIAHRHRIDPKYTATNQEPSQIQGGTTIK